MFFKTEHFFDEIDFTIVIFFQVFNKARENILFTKLEKTSYLNTVDTSSLGHSHVILSLVDVQGFLGKKIQDQNMKQYPSSLNNTLFMYIEYNWAVRKT